jgi:hypothetical protein
MGISPKGRCVCDSEAVATLGASACAERINPIRVTLVLGGDAAEKKSAFQLHKETET